MTARRPARPLRDRSAALLVVLAGALALADPASARPEVGLASGSEPDTATTLGAKVVRYEFPIGTSVREIRPVVASFAEKGVRVVLLAGFYGSVPSPAEARSLGAWAREFGPRGRFWRGKRGRRPVREIEFGNETSYGYQYGEDGGYWWERSSYKARARAYGRTALEAARAMRGTRVGLLVQADDSNTQSANWIREMLGAAPGLARRVAAWTLHPYGPSWRPRIDRLYRHTAAAGASRRIPVAITEYGVASDDGRCLSDNYGWPRCLSYGEAAQRLAGAVRGIRSHLGNRLKLLFIYQARDQKPSGATEDRDDYFGVLQNNKGDKGPLTRAARAVISGR